MRLKVDDRENIETFISGRLSTRWRRRRRRRLLGIWDSELTKWYLRWLND